MAKIIFRKNRDGDIYNVQSFSRYKNKYTEEEILKRIEEFNNNIEESDYLLPYEVLDVEDTTYELFDFLLGEGKYKSQKDIRDICERLEDAKKATIDVDEVLEDVKRNIYELQYNIDNIKEKIAEKYNIQID